MGQMIYTTTVRWRGSKAYYLTNLQEGTNRQRHAARAAQMTTYRQPKPARTPNSQKIKLSDRGRDKISGNQHPLTQLISVVYIRMIASFLSKYYLKGDVPVRQSFKRFIICTYMC